MTYSFRHLLSTAIFLCYTSFIPSSLAYDYHQQIQDLLGRWQTTLNDNGSELMLILEFEATESDSLNCLVHRPEMGMNNVPYAKFIVHGDSILLPGLKMKYNENHLSGVFTAFGPELAIDFRKIQDIPSFTITCPEKNPEWMFKTDGAIWSAPSILDDRLFFGNDSGTFYAIDLKDKTIKWKFKSEGAIRSKACFLDGRIAFASDDGHLYLLDIKSGNLKWKVDIGNAITPRIDPTEEVYNYDYLCSSPTSRVGFIYVGSKDSNLYAVDAAKGNIVWKYKTGGMVRSTPAIDDEMVYVGSWDHLIYALDKIDGHLIWEYDAGGPIQSSPLIVEDKIIFGSRSANLFALDKHSGKELWHTPYWGSWVESSPVLYDDKIYIGSSDLRKIFAMDPSTGNVLLGSTVEGWAWPTPAVNSDFIFIGSVGTLHYLDGLRGGFYAFDRETGKAEWQIKVEDNPDVFAYGFASSPAIWKDWVFVGGLDGNIYGLKAE